MRSDAEGAVRPAAQRARRQAAPSGAVRPAREALRAGEPEKQFSDIIACRQKRLEVRRLFTYPFFPVPIRLTTFPQPVVLGLFAPVAKPKKTPLSVPDALDPPRK